VRPPTVPGPSLSDGTLLCVIGTLVAAFAVSVLVLHGPRTGNTFWDGWVYTLAEAACIIPILLRARREAPFRRAWVAIAAALALKTVGDVVYTFHDQHLSPIPSPAPSDAFHLLAFVMMIVGVTVMMQSSFGRIHASVRLDGAITGLTLAAVAAMVWFGPVLDVSGRPLQVVVDMAYPICDVLLLALLVSGLAPRKYQPSWPTALLMAGVAWWVAGDVMHLNEVAAGTYRTGSFVDLSWLIGFFLIGVSAAVRDRRRAGGTRASVSSPAGITLVPVVFGLVSLAVITTSIYQKASAVVLLFAVSALVLVIVRMWLTLREVRQSATNYRDARTDYLTGLPNRRGFVEIAQSRLFAHDALSGLAGMLVIDLDGFKEVNDALGHSVGDELLCVVAQRFERRLAGRGMLARVGGDEYACALAIGSESELLVVAYELTETLVEPCALDGLRVRVGASIGVAIASRGDTAAEELMRCADVAMYEAKRTQSHVAVYRSGADPNSRERLAFTNELREAIDARAFTLHYQPTLDMRTHRVHGVEALVRWHHPTRGLLPPDEFIPLAERHGLIPKLTRAVLDEAIAEAVRLDGNGLRLMMSVNISRHDLIDDGLADYVAGLLARYGYPAERLTLEITESALVEDPSRVERSVRALRRLGVRVSIDDFGVGYSSMSQLLELAIDELKIDRSFVTGLAADARAQAIVRSAIELARALNLTVVAEGIERPDELSSLRSYGADVGQGYVIARPLTSRQLDAFLGLPVRSTNSDLAFTLASAAD
jgi:diguanylate cyclase (GGDEF)-like protein